MKHRSRAGALLLGVALPAGLIPSALADDRSILTTITDPVATATAANGTAGNITVEFGGQIVINQAGPAALLNSNNALRNIGTIQNNFTGGGAVGVQILGGLTGGFVTEAQANASVTVAGGGAGNIGLLLNGGPAAFNGSVSFGAASYITVTGKDSTGVAIRAPINGNLDLSGSIFMTGEGASGVVILAPISGAFATGLGVSVAGTDRYTGDKVDPLSGSAVAIGASIDFGILNNGSAAPNDGGQASTLASSGNLPTFAIQPSLAGAAASNITIGVLGDTLNPNFSFINRGNIRASQNDAGMSTIGVAIGELGVATKTVTLTGGIYNRGTIVAGSVTANTFATSVPSASANATAFIIGDGARINNGGAAPAALLNDGTITATVSGDRPGNATAISILAGASVPSIVNNSIASSASLSTDLTIASLTAYALRDQSGSVLRLVNNGRLTANTSALNNGGQLSVAADISRATLGQTFTNTGVVEGDVLFGSAGMNGSVAGNQFTIEGASASFFGALRSAGAGTIDVHVSEAGTGGSFRSSNARLTSLNVGTGGVVAVTLNKGSTSAALIAATGAISFGAGSRVTLEPTSFLPDNGTYTLIQSGTALSFADFAASTTQPIPFIFNGGLARSGNSLVLTLQRKTAGELGLSGNAATMYQPMAQAALADGEFGSALLRLTTAAEVEAAIGSTVPDVAGGARALTVALTDQATGVIGARERNLITSPSSARDEFRFWGQEFYNNVSANRTSDGPGFSGAGQGLAVGVEWGSLAKGRYGVGYTFFSSQEIETHPRDTKTNGDWNMLSAYAAWRSGNIFLTPQINLAQGDLLSRRTVAADTVVRSATANWSNYLAAGGFTAGYIMNLGGFQIMPQIAFDGMYLRESAYRETGASGMNLALAQQNQQSVRSFAGVLGHGNYNWDNGTLQPQLLVGWSHEFLSSPTTIDGSFESTPGSPFHLVGPTLEPNKIVGGASFAYVFGNWAAGVSYDAAKSSNTLAQSATISLSSRF